jgi:hypothetical protein
MTASISTDYMMQRFLNKPKLSDLFDAEKEKAICKLIWVTDLDSESNLRVFDQKEEDNLILLHYLKEVSSVYHVRGLVVDTESLEIVGQSFPFTEELAPANLTSECPQWDTPPSTQSSTRKCNDCPISGDVSDYYITHAYEGTILRFFQGRVTKKWYLSTHKKIDGRKSRWSGPMFGDVFDSFWKDPNKLGDGLDGRACYIFLISHPENRLVCKISAPKIMLLGYSTGNCLYSLINPDENVSDPMEFLKEHAIEPSAIEKRKSFHVSTLDELKEKTEQLSWEDYTGLLLTYWDILKPRLKCYKIVPDEYTERRELRGSEPNFRLRYLQLHADGEDETFRELFPEKKEFFDQIEKDMTTDLPRYLKQLYYERYSKKQFTRLPPEEHYVLEKTKNGYVPGRSIIANLRLTLNNCNPRQLNALIKYMYTSCKPNNACVVRSSTCEVSQDADPAAKRQLDSSRFKNLQEENVDPVVECRAQGATNVTKSHT